MNPYGVPEHGRVVVFTGDTLGAEIVSNTFAGPGSRLLILPPAGLGDVWRNIRADISAMVVIDCVEKGASLWHREICSGCEAGIAMFGAGGRGALRAAESAGTGIRGVGRVFDRVTAGLLEADDEVLSGPDGFALVTLRIALEDAIEKGVTGRDEAEELIRLVRQCPYAERTWGLLEKWIKAGAEEGPRQDAASFIMRHAEDPRPADAMSAIRMALSDKSPVDSGYAASDNIFRDRWRLSEIFYRPFMSGGKVVSGARILEMSRRLQDSWSRMLRTDFFVRQWLKEHGIRPPRMFVEDFVKRRVEEHRDRALSFLLENGMTRCEWMHLLEQEASVRWAEKERGALLADAQGENSFAADWAATHGIDAPAGHGPCAGDWVIEKGPCFFGLVWEERVAFFDQLRLSGNAAQFAKKAGSGGACDT